jgi:hypothetical protein
VKADAQSVEREALQWAADRFRDRASVLSAEGSRRILVASAVNRFLAAYDMAKHSRKTDEKILVEDLLHEFKEEYFTPDLRREVAAALLERNEQLPSSLRELVVDYLRSPKVNRKAGRDFFDLKLRNMLIAETINIISERWKFHPTRNEATTENASAASIVRDALAAGAKLCLTEAAINKIWRRFGPSARAHLSTTKLEARLERQYADPASPKYLGDLLDSMEPFKAGPWLDSIGINYDD